MFNPKQALQKIRRTKNQREEVNSITEDVQPLFPQKQTQIQNSSEFQKRVSSLEVMVSRLSEELTNSNETISKLKRQNSNLETQVLKLEYENSQMKSNQVISEIRRNNSQKKISSHNNTFMSEKKEEKEIVQKIPLEKQREVETIRKVEPKPILQKQVYSLEVEEVVEQIKKEPIETILHKKQYNFRALKGSNKNSQLGNKYLKELINIEKQYSKTMKKPVLVIKLDDADFE